MAKNYYKILVIGLGVSSVVLFQNCAGSGSSSTNPMIACSQVMPKSYTPDIHMQFSKLHGKLLIKQNGNIVFNECDLASNQGNVLDYQISTDIFSTADISTLPNSLDLYVHQFDNHSVDSYNLVSSFIVSDLGVNCVSTDPANATLVIEATNVTPQQVLISSANQCAGPVTQPTFDLTE